MISLKLLIKDEPPVYEQAQLQGLFQEGFSALRGLPFDDLIKRTKRCNRCDVRRECNQVVLPQGPLDSKSLFVGRNPGIQEDRQGVPFYQKAPGGVWFDKYLDAAGYDRNNVYVTNAIYCHTKGDRVPTMEELTICSMWKSLELDYLPELKYVYLLGNDAIRQFFGHQVKSIVRIFGEVYKVPFRGRWLIVFPCYHPAFVLRNPPLALDQFVYLKTSRNIITAEEQGRLNWLRE